jgi:hypothetical protein
MQIKKIELVLENCEVFTFNRDEIGHFAMEGITRTIARRASNSIGDSLICAHLSLSLHRKANTENADVTKFSEGLDLEEWAGTPFERIRSSQDLVAVAVTYEDGTEEEIYVDWDLTQHNQNPYQTNVVNHFGDLFITVSKDQSFDDVFDVKEINDPSKMDLFWTLMS